jgi:hypothetical protein
MAQGQINRGSQFGELLYGIAKSADTNIIVEIGAWNGCGSTRCIIDGIIDSKIIKDFVSLEVCPEMHEQAKTNLAGSPVKLLYGSVITPEEIMPFVDGLDELKEWYERDLDYIRKAPNVMSLIPTPIDLLLLDGGGFSTYPEWIKLKSRTKIVALDDTRTVKTKKVREELLSDSHYKMIADNQSDRNGYSVFTRIC